MVLYKTNNKIIKNYKRYLKKIFFIKIANL